MTDLSQQLRELADRMDNPNATRTFEYLDTRDYLDLAAWATRLGESEDSKDVLARITPGDLAVYRHGTFTLYKPVSSNQKVVSIFTYNTMKELDTENDDDDDDDDEGGNEPDYFLDDGLKGEDEAPKTNKLMDEARTGSTAPPITHPEGGIAQHQDRQLKLQLLSIADGQIQLARSAYKWITEED